MQDIRLSLTRGVTLDVDAEPMLFDTPVPLYWLGAGLRCCPAGLKAAFRRLSGLGATVSELREIVSAIDGEKGLRTLDYWIARLSQRALLARTLLQDGIPVATLEPISPYFQHRDLEAEPERAYRLSRFALTRRDGDEFVLEAAQGLAFVRLHTAVAHAAVHCLATPHTAADLAAAVPGLSESTSDGLIALLVHARTVHPADRPEDDDPSVGSWAFHDLLFHARSRLGRSGVPGGGPQGRLDTALTPPVIKPAMSNVAVPLARPDLFALKESDLPFTKVLEERGSARRQGREPPTVAHLGELLYRAARVKRIVTDGGLSFRPYAGCAGLYALEIYPLVTSCSGLEPALYHYDPQDHRLLRVADPSEDTRRLAHLAGATALLDGTPQILLVVAARFQRFQTRYRSTAYSSILQDLGSLYQTLYLVARAMGLAPVALGGGYPDLFARASGLDPFVEASVGEFIVCSSVDGAEARSDLPAEAVVGADGKGGFGTGVIRKDRPTARVEEAS